MSDESAFDVLTHTDRGTPMGELMRRYWIPAGLSEELPEGGAPLPVRILGEDLVLFRDGQGRPGLLGIHCPHRGADLSYGRLGYEGLRCMYHGWLFDIHGNCLDQPGEPEGSTFYQRIHQKSYPCTEKAGAIFAYLGPGEPPLLPNWGFLTWPEDQVCATKLLSECNYMQGNEGNIDLQHLSLLHQHVGRPETFDPAWSFGDRGAAPGREKVELEPTSYGLRVCKTRQLGGGQKHLYLGSYMLPWGFARAANQGINERWSPNWHIPIDDAHHWKFVWYSSREGPVDREAVKRSRLELAPDYHPLRHRGNRYLQDRSTMDTTYTGIGLAFQAQDLCATEGAGPTQDRMEEHLGANDGAIAAARNMMLTAIKDVEDGKDPPNVIRDPAKNHYPIVFAHTAVVPNETDWRAYFRQLEEEAKAKEESATGAAHGASLSI